MDICKKLEVGDLAKFQGVDDKVLLRFLNDKRVIAIRRAWLERYSTLYTTLAVDAGRSGCATMRVPWSFDATLQVLKYLGPDHTTEKVIPDDVADTWRPKEIIGYLGIDQGLVQDMLLRTLGTPIRPTHREPLVAIIGKADFIVLQSVLQPAEVVRFCMEYPSVESHVEVSDALQLAMFNEIAKSKHGVLFSMWRTKMCRQIREGSEQAMAQKMEEIYAAQGV
jgi:hypothetical protein